MQKIRHIADNIWKIVLVKTIDDTEPIYYRLVNLKTYQTIDVPAYRILDEVINNKKVIKNLICKNNSISIVNDDGYECTDELIKIDEFDKEVPDLLEWSIQHGDLGVQILNRFDTDKNILSPSNISISSSRQIAWTCERGHTIYCEFSVYFSTKCNCPVCEAERNDAMLSLKTWACLTQNKDILNDYDAAENNKIYSHDIGWKQRNKVWFRRNDEEVSECLYNVTVKNIEPPFSEKNRKKKVNLKR